VIPCDAIVPAIGQTCVVDCVLPPEEVEISRWKTLVADEITGQTRQPWIFSGGDCVTGPATLIGALAAGKNAARFMARYLETGECAPSDGDWMEKLISKLGIFYFKEKMPYQDSLRKMHPPVMSPEERIKSFAEVETGVKPAQAVKEAARCLRCFRIALAAV
jgi:formate dehydrogenase beta subunit